MESPKNEPVDFGADDETVAAKKPDTDEKGDDVNVDEFGDDKREASEAGDVDVVKEKETEPIYWNDSDDEDNNAKDADGSGELSKKRKKLEGTSAPKVKKHKKGNSKEAGSGEKKAKKMFEREAEESGEGSGSDSDGSDSSDEDRNEYEYDDFVVREGEDDDDSGGSGDEDHGVFESTEEGQEGKGKKKKTKTLTRLVKKKDVRLEEDDLDLIRDNIEGGYVEDDAVIRNFPVRKNRDRGGDDDDDNEIAPEDVVEPDDDEGFTGDRHGDRVDRSRRGFYDDDEDSDMDGFIENEEDDDRVDDQEGADGRAARRRDRPRARARFDGPTHEMINDITAMFGVEYDDLDLEGEDADEQGDEDDGEGYGTRAAKADKGDPTKAIVQRIKSSYERSQLVENFCTDRDDDIRLMDVPERSQDILVGRATPTDAERSDEAIWMAEKLAEKIWDEAFADCALKSSYEGGNHEAQEMRTQSLLTDRNLPPADQLAESLKEPVESVLKFFQVERMEVPFVWTYRQDYLHPMLKRKHLWLISNWDEKWERLYAIKKRLTEQLQAIKDAAESGDPEVERIERESQARQLKSAKARVEAAEHAVADADEKHERALTTVDERDDEATAEDREQVELCREDFERSKLRLVEAQRDLQNALQQEEDATRRRVLRSQFQPEAATEVLKLFPEYRYQPMIDGAKDEVELKDVALFLDLLLKGAQAPLEPAGSTSTSRNGHGKESASAGNGEDDVAAIAVADGEDDEGNLGDGEEGGALSRSKAAALRNAEAKAKEALASKQQHQRVRRIVLGKDDYRKYRRVPRLREFIEKFSITAADFGDAVRHGFRNEPPAALDLTAEELAVEYTDDFILKSESQVLRAVNVLMASELSAEPSVRQAARAQLKARCTITTRPTPKGLLSINPFGDIFGIHYLTDKPLTDFLKGKTRTLFLRLLEMEKNGLITISIDPPKRRTGPLPESPLVVDAGVLLMDAKFLEVYMPSIPRESEAHPASRDSWDKLRMLILETCIEKHLIPSLLQEFKRELIQIGRDAIVEEASERFNEILSNGPYRPKPENWREETKSLLLECPERIDRHTVASIFVSQMEKQPICMAFVDKVGVLRAQYLLPEKAYIQKRDVLKRFLADNKPDIIILNSSGGMNSKRTAELIERELVPEIDDVVRTQARERMRYDDFENEDAEEGYKPHIALLKDEVAVIFKGSSRAKKMFPDFEPGVAAAICLARYAQEPLAEYCNMWKSANAVGQFGFEALHLDVHPLKHLLGNAKLPLRRALERCLVDAVGDVGVDINRAVTYDHLSGLLGFVGGLGIRKADSLCKNVRKRLTTVQSRQELLVKKLLGPIVYTNAAGFLRISENPLDPLDNTRIHPECYHTHDFAPKICADALETICNDENKYINTESIMRDSKNELKKRMNKQPGWVDLWAHGRPTDALYPEYREMVKNREGQEVLKKVSVELKDKLFMLLLDDYAVDLEVQLKKGKRRKQLDQIKDELRFPWLDLRKPMVPITENVDEFFTIISGESDKTLYVGLKTGCVVIAINEFEDQRTGRMRERATVKLDNGLRGNISVYEVTDEIEEHRKRADDVRLGDYISVGMHLPAVVVGINKAKIVVDVSIRPSHLKRTEDSWVLDILDGNMNNRYLTRWWPTTTRNGDALFDQYCPAREALEAYRKAEQASINRIEGLVAARASSSGGGVGGTAARKNSAQKARQIYHPLFANVDCRGAEDKLRGLGAGEVLFRPSSKGADSLSITWAFQDGWFKHVDVEEKGKTPGQLSLGTQLFVKDADLTESFSDLDEIHARYIEPMNDFVKAITSHTHFRSGSKEEVEADMREQLSKHPKLIPYRLRFQENRAGAFALTWMSVNVNSEKPVKSELVIVRPDGYKMAHKVFNSPDEFIRFFKQMALGATSSGKGAPRPVAGDRVPLAAASAAAAPPARRTRFDALPPDGVAAQMPLSVPVPVGAGLIPMGAPLHGMQGPPMGMQMDPYLQHMPGMPPAPHMGGGYPPMLPPQHLVPPGQGYYPPPPGY